MNAPIDLTKLNFTQISNELFIPLEWLDSKVPTELKILPNPYNDYPFILKNINHDYSLMKDFVSNHEKELKKIGIISTDDGAIIPKRNTKIRNTYNIIPNKSFIDDYNRIFESQKESIERFFNVSLMQSIDPQILIYKDGCFYKTHSDNCSEIVDGNGELVEYKLVAPARVVTTVLFISNCTKEDGEFNFDGGELEFDFLYDKQFKKFSFKPKEGDFISFLSNPYFSHNVKEVISGTRISVVQWHNAIVH